MSHLADDIASDMIANFGLIDRVYINSMDERDAEFPLVVVTQTSGAPNRIDFAWADETIQVLVTSAPNDPEGGLDLIERLYRRYHGAHHLDLAGHQIKWSEASQRPYALGRDDKGREQYVFNLLLSYRSL